jgi:hypothetical protein
MLFRGAEALPQVHPALVENPAFMEIQSCLNGEEPDDRVAAEAFERASAIVESIAENVEEEKLRASFLASSAEWTLLRKQAAGRAL